MPCKFESEGEGGGGAPCHFSRDYLFPLEAPARSSLPPSALGPVTTVFFERALFKIGDTLEKKEGGTGVISSQGDFSFFSPLLALFTL